MPNILILVALLSGIGLVLFSLDLVSDAFNLPHKWRGLFYLLAVPFLLVAELYIFIYILVFISEAIRI